MGKQVRKTSPLYGVSGTSLYEAVGANGLPVSGPRIVLVAVVHGNEPVGDRVFEALIPRIAGSLVRGALLLVRANERAAELDLRQTPTGVNLNRLWDRETLARLARAEKSTLCYEELRALELAPLLIGCDVLLDLHSTSRPAPPFLLFRDDQAHARLALQLGVQNLITGMHEQRLVPGGLCSNVGLATGERAERVGLTFEAGQHQDPGNLDRALAATLRLLRACEMWADAPPPVDVEPRVYEVLDRVAQAPPGADPFRFVGYAGGEIVPGQRVRALESFEHVRADEVVLRRGPDVVRARSPFVMLMPAPTAPAGDDLYFVCQERHGVIAGDKLRSPNEARAEAVSIERVLDVLGDDELERGTTLVSFDPRRSLDLCAELIGRAIRLPVGSRDRRITVVGRGEWDGRDSDRRAGVRYRQMVRRALSEGVPLTRVQLLRGAALGWLDTLTTGDKSGLFSQHGGAQARLLLSLAHPHTVSILAIGDLDHALATGDTRHCRVALVIEAATVEPDGSDAYVSVVRAAIVSGRIAQLSLAQQVIAGLRAEHAELVTAQDRTPRLNTMLDGEGALSAPATVSSLRPLRYALTRLQLRAWRDALAAVVHTPLTLGTPSEQGQWLASVMSSTGILDAASLMRLLVDKSEAGWRVQPDGIDRVLDGPDSALDRLLDQREGRPSLPIALLGRDVDGDTLPRWVGFKRDVRQCEVIPGLRGKDLELAASEGEVRARIGRWFDAARALGADAPGEVLVVMAGDGMNPSRESDDSSWQLLAAHRALLLDPTVGYLRIQHAQGTHFAWLKDVAETLASRPSPGAPVALQFEEEHGATLNVVMVAKRTEPGTTAVAWSLDGWTVLACAVVLADLEPNGQRGYRVGLFTDQLPSSDGLALASRSVNDQLLHFGRAHCEGLMRQSGLRVRGDVGAPPLTALDSALCAVLSRWVHRARGWDGAAVPKPPDALDDRAAWVRRHLGIADKALAQALAHRMASRTAEHDAAVSLWRDVAAWPGALWDRRAAPS